MTISNTPKALFSPIKVGNVQLKHRVALPPLTRFRANTDHVVNDELHTVYYGQRSAVPGTLLVTEATFISPNAGGYPNAPGIWSQEQVTAWSSVFKKVHDNGSYIFVQLWNLGRQAKPELLKSEGRKYVSASAIPEEGSEYVPEALTIPEIQEFVKEYVVAAKNSIAAGADGVEIHGANGYLLDQFLHDKNNIRTDQYGGSIENRARFLLEVVDAVIAAVGPDRTAIRLSPFGVFGDVHFSGSPVPTFAYVLDELEKRANNGSRLAYVHLVEPRAEGSLQQANTSNEFARTIWSGTLFRTGNYDRETAIEAAERDPNTIIGIGRNFISNPDLPYRLENNLPLTHYKRELFYSPGPKGYIDYPTYEEEVKSEQKTQ